MLHIKLEVEIFEPNNIEIYRIRELLEGYNLDIVGRSKTYRSLIGQTECIIHT